MSDHTVNEQATLLGAQALAEATSDPGTRIEELRREIEHNSYLYYAKDAPAISDAAFDSLMHELRALEAAHPEFYDPNSPTQRVGGYVGEQFAPIRHERRMYSLDDAMDGDELDACTEINTREFIKASRLVSSITGMNVQANKAIVGANAFAHSSGIHQDGVLKKRDTYEIIDPADVGAGTSQIVLTARSGHAALKHRLEELGYELEGEALDQVYEAFLNLADKKKEVYDEDLESLVNERDRNESALYALEGVQVSTGFPLTPTATVTLRNAADQVVTACEYGTGPIDAVYKAVNKIVQVDNELTEFSVQSITRGIDALGEVTIRVTAPDGEVYTGRGSDGDIVVSSTKAYLNALNRLLNDKLEHRR